MDAIYFYIEIKAVGKLKGLDIDIINNTWNSKEYAIIRQNLLENDALDIEEFKKELYKELKEKLHLKSKSKLNIITNQLSNKCKNLRPWENYEFHLEYCYNNDLINVISVH